MSLVVSIVITISAYFAGEAGIFFLLSGIFSFPRDFFLIYLSVHLAFQLGIAAFLIISRRQFYNLHSGQGETRVNGANKITLFRISMLPFLVFLLLAVERFPGKNTGPVLVIALALTFLSDLIDGRIARTKKLETYIGKILDSGSDYMLLGATAVSFFYFRLIRPWLFWIIIGRLFINALSMFVLFLVRKKLSPQTTIFGKVAIAAIMVLFVIEAAVIALGGISTGVLPLIVRYAEIAVCILIVLSVIDKILYFVRSVSRPREAEWGDRSTDPLRQKELEDPYRETMLRREV
jgi:phosphatidylglycerophosphate synthase